MLIGGFVFMLGNALNGVAMNVEMLIIGRLLLCGGVGYGNQVISVVTLSIIMGWKLT